jgi:hypothetical protein
VLIFFRLGMNKCSSFSGCGRSVEQTLDDIRIGKISPNDLPTIQVIVGTDTSLDGKPWYFSLNNRRLWVLKECQKEGLLERQHNMIRVRIRAFKSKREQERYTLQNCSLEAKFIREKHTAAMDNIGTSFYRSGSNDEMEEDQNTGDNMPPRSPVTCTGSRMLTSTENSAKDAVASSADKV